MKLFLRHIYDHVKYKLLGGRPSHWAKKATVLEYGSWLTDPVLIETGTYLGEMVRSTRKVFKEIYTVELSSKLYEQVSDELIQYQNVFMYQGDSAEELPEILASTENDSAIFWLDAHYSGGNTAKGDLNTPIMKELELILTARKYKSTIILIDDADDFNGTGDYPTIDAIKAFVFKLNVILWVSVDNNIIVIK